MRRVTIENRHGIYHIMNGQNLDAMGSTLESALAAALATSDITKDRVLEHPLLSPAVAVIERLLGDGPEQEGQIGTGVQSA